MKKQINEIKRMQQLAGIINESQLNEAKYDLGPEIDYKKLAKVLDTIKYDPKRSQINSTDSVYDKDETAYLVKVLKALPKICAMLDNDDKMEKATDYLNDVASLDLLNASKEQDKKFEPLANAISDLNMAADEVDPKYAIRAYKAIYAFLNKIK